MRQSRRAYLDNLKYYTTNILLLAVERFGCASSAQRTLLEAWTGRGASKTIIPLLLISVQRNTFRGGNGGPAGAEDQPPA